MSARNWQGPLPDPAGDDWDYDPRAVAGAQQRRASASMSAPRILPLAILPDEIGASSQQRSILEILIGAYPRKVRGPSLIDALYADDPNGGADNARTVVSVQMNRLRKRMAGSGWTIPKLGGGNSNVAYYGIARAA